MADTNTNREIFSAALSAHVSELILFWHGTGLSCRWLVPDSEHCYVDDTIIGHLKAFDPDSIENSEIREQWLSHTKPLLESDEPTSTPFSLRLLTWLLRVVESPHRDDISQDSWNLIFWSVRMVDLPNRVATRLSNRLDGDVRFLEFDTVINTYCDILKEVYPTDGKKLEQDEKILLINRFDRLRRFKNLIFYGIANIGKANLSKSLLRNWKTMTGREIGMHCVTVFHKNSCYADMVESRISGDWMSSTSSASSDRSAPRVIAHHITEPRYFFEPFTNNNIQEGLFLSLCRAAAYNPDKDYVFMIDCIDEAKIEDVFGEVSHMFDSFARVPWRKGSGDTPGAWDLESKGARSIRLSLSGRIFFIPANVYILGTANESGLFDSSVDEHLFQTFAVEYLPAKTAEELSAEMLSHRSHTAFARLEEYVGHSIRLWDRINTILISVSGHKSMIGYGPLLSMCEEILQSGDVIEANKIVLGTWRYRMMPPIRLRMETMLHSDEEHREALKLLIDCLNCSWLRIHVEVEGFPGSEAIYISFDSTDSN